MITFSKTHETPKLNLLNFYLWYDSLYLRIKVGGKMKKDDFNFLIDFAIKAPSGHNTQPWKFENIENGIMIHPDFSRALTIVDSDNHSLYISLGCSLENIIITASQRGFESIIHYPADAKSSITVLCKNADITNNTLYDVISLRQVNRSKYSDKKVSNEDLKRLNKCFDIPGISLKILDGKESFINIIPLIIEGNILQFGNKQFINELTSWFRYSKSEAEKTKDGLWTAAMGLPNMGKFIGNMVMKNFVTAKSEAKRINNILQHTQGLAIFISDKYNVVSWINIGRAFQRFGLTATKLGISHAHLNMPCEEVSVRYKLAKELGIENRHPLLLIRYGYAKKEMPYSFRRNFEDVVLNK